MKWLLAIWQWIDERTGLAGILPPLVRHPVPPGAKWMYVFGSATLLAFVIQIASGIALATAYIPASGEAYDSIQYIMTRAPFGALLRGIHFFGASAMVLFAGVHLIRVYLMGAYKYPRELNWLTGVLLLGLTVGMGFTGQILRWDQNAVWSAVVGAEQAARTPIIGKWLVRGFLSGGMVGTATLSHFFVLHVFLLPGLIIAIVGLHLHLVLRNGISEPPVVGVPVDPKTYRENYEAMLAREGVPFWPCAAWRDIVFGMVVVAGVVLLAWFVGAPSLGKPPDPSIIDAQPHPDWYLLWYFAVLALLPHRAESAVIILAPLLAGLVLLALPFLANRGERHWRRRPWAVGIVIFTVTCIGAFWRAGVQEHWTPKFNATPLPASVIGAADGPVHDGGIVFNTKGCLFCHDISGYGGTRGPELTDVGDRLTHDQIIIRIVNGGYNMPAYADNITPTQLAAVTAFLESRKAP